MTDQNDAAALIEAVREGLYEAVNVDGHQVVLTGAANLRVIDMEEYLPDPIRIREVVSVNDPGSLLEYIKRQATGSTVLYADSDRRQIVGVLDHHQLAAPSWGSHRVRMQLALSEEWKAWKDKDRQSFSQEDFSEFLEDRAEDIISPQAAALIEMVQLFRATKSANFRRAVNLANGQNEIVWEENIQAKVGAGEDTVPDKLKLALPVFSDSDLRVSLDARVRFRLREGKLSWHFALVRSESALRAAWSEVLQQIAEGLPEEMNIPILKGSGIAE